MARGHLRVQHKHTHSWSYATWFAGVVGVCVLARFGFNFNHNINVSINHNINSAGVNGAVTPLNMPQPSSLCHALETRLLEYLESEADAQLSWFQLFTQFTMLAQATYTAIEWSYLLACENRIVQV